MKRIYEKPCTLGIEIEEKYGFMEGSEKGQVNPEQDAMSKKGDIVEVETGIPSNFTNIWGEEDED